MWRITTAVLISASAVLGQGSIDLDLHAVSQDAAFANMYDAGPVVVDPAGLTEFTIALFVRAQVVGDAAATGLTTFDGRLTDDGSGSWAASFLTSTDVFGVPVPGDDSQMRRGMTLDYRATCSCDPPGDPGNGWDDGMGGWTFLPLSIAPTGATDAIGGLDDVYRVEWTSVDFTPRVVTLTVDAAGGGYQTPVGLVVTESVDPGMFTIEIVPGPGVGALIGCVGLMALRRGRGNQGDGHADQ